MSSHFGKLISYLCFKYDIYMVNQVVLLAGGKGTRMRELTETLPKPMVEIGGIPVLTHLMDIFKNFQDFSFLVATGYKSNLIEDYYKSSDQVKTLDTGEETNTGGRVFKLKDSLEDKFIVTYGDGLANVNISELINFHNSHNKIGTVTVTNPVSRFGLVEFDENNLVTKFTEKPKLDGFINIGFMVFDKSVLSTEEGVERSIFRLKLGNSQHKVICEAIEKGDSVRSEGMMREHLNILVEYIELFEKSDEKLTLSNLITYSGIELSAFKPTKKEASN